MNWAEPSPLPSSAIFPDMHPLVARRLFHHGITTSESARAFLDPLAYDPTPAAFLPGLNGVVDRLEMAIRKHESICVWGDFDVDGQTSTTIFFQTLHELKGDVSFHIPVRAREGHGVNLPQLKEILDHGAKVILTCDTGITAHGAAEYARARGVDMLITDHHDLPDLLPTAAAITNPKFLAEGHPLSTLSGSGVAYKLSEELYARFGRLTDATRHLDLAALGLVADLARLTGDARYLVQSGLEALRKTVRLGLQMMMEMAELTATNLTEEHIGFVLAPRLNALGRLGDANPAVDLLTTSDPIRARVLVTQLEGLNTQRQLLCSQVTQAAEAQLRADPSLLTQPILVLGHPSWPSGVVGIVASRLVEHYRKPVILFSTPAGQAAQGSARSIEGLNITAAIAAQKDLLLNFGGHPMAAGLSLELEKLPAFTKRLIKTVTEMMKEGLPGRDLELDAWLSLPEITLDLANVLERLAPYGPGNEKLTLATHGLKMQSVVPIGRNKEHLRIKVKDEAGNSQNVLWWNGAEEKDTLPEGSFDLAYTLRASDWRGSLQVQMEFVDLHSLETVKIEENERQFEVVDHRNVQERDQLLAALSEQHATMLWAEGLERKKTGGKGRHELEPADALVIWTTPPSPDELRLALETVHPQKVYLFAVTEPSEPPETFIGQLAGLLKFAINHRDGRVPWSELDTATAQRSATVRAGVHWLVSQGRFFLAKEELDELVVSKGNGTLDLPGASHLWAEIQSLIAETNAYRTYFKRADKDALFY